MKDSKAKDYNINDLKLLNKRPHIPKQTSSDYEVNGLNLKADVPTSRLGPNVRLV